ncbi:MAG: SMC-Scp complex subunit ScpB [Terriglobia bacterium]|jgi:segregation and condensation protein B
MVNDEVLRAQIEGILYVAPEPVTLDTIVKSLPDEDRERIKAKLQELTDEYEKPEHGIHIRQVAGGYKFATKPEHHDVLRKFVKSLKQPSRLSKPALETLAVIAYRQPVTLPEIDAIRGVDCGGVIHTLLERKLVVTAGRKNVVGRPILYRTSRDFLVHFGLKDVSELPSLKEFEELARQALGAELALAEGVPGPESGPGESSPDQQENQAGELPDEYAAPNAAAAREELVSEPATTEEGEVDTAGAAENHEPAMPSTEE